MPLEVLRHDIRGVIEAKRHEALRGFDRRRNDIGVASAVESFEPQLIRDVLVFLKYPGG